MSGDHQQWDNGPEHAKQVQSKDAYEQEVRAEKIRVVIWILAIAGIIGLGLLYHSGWRP